MRTGSKVEGPWELQIMPAEFLASNNIVIAGQNGKNPLIKTGTPRCRCAFQLPQPRPALPGRVPEWRRSMKNTMIAVLFAAVLLSTLTGFAQTSSQPTMPQPGQAAQG